MSNSAERASLPVTASYAGIATGLTGSRAVARIDKLSDGTYRWPDGLPRVVAGGPLTVAANVLEHGVGGLNINGCRIDTNGEPNPSIARRKGAVNHLSDR